MKVKLNGRLVYREFIDVDVAFKTMKNFLNQGEYFTITLQKYKYYVILDRTNNLSDGDGFVKFKEAV